MTDALDEGVDRQSRAFVTLRGGREHLAQALQAAAQVRGVDLTNIHAVDPHRPFAGLIEARDEAIYGRLARADATDHRHPLARRRLRHRLTKAGQSLRREEVTQIVAVAPSRIGAVAERGQQGADVPHPLLLVDDQALFREGLRTILSARPEFEIVGEAANGQ